ncbi:hypothetical protein [Rubellimicrobium arenae]|uniref:hypothetical protein n=1 Tax=Rubellimicrobium arenae TaxID=2817372 RepID=UPI001B30D364|nr:hypothetical protein [Rubellimicrobium arenae]
MTRPSLPIRWPAGVLALVALAPMTLQAQDAAPSAAAPSLSVELNDAAPTEGGCRLTFLAENGLGTDLASLSLETVVLSTAGQVEQVTLFDFGDLPAGRPRVRQFDLAGLACDAIGQVLINGVTTCDGAGADPATCISGLALSSRNRIELIG